MTTLEQITYDAGRHALADQEALVAGIRQRTGTLLAAHALVAAFLGAPLIRTNVAAAFGYRRLRAQNARKVRWLSLLSGLLGLLMIVQTVAWIVALTR